MCRINSIFCSCRKIENTLNDCLSFMWFSGNQTPDYNTINLFPFILLERSYSRYFYPVW
ncbi:transposase, partial [Bacteroides heparinolyticus]|uniref:transposase n=1 Tax=Prevotella heparinolytica TaxID=28113 RepID=UPI0035A038DD